MDYRLEFNFCKNVNDNSGDTGTMARIVRKSDGAALRLAGDARKDANLNFKDRDINHDKNEDKWGGLSVDYLNG